MWPPKSQRLKHLITLFLRWSADMHFLQKVWPHRRTTGFLSWMSYNTAHIEQVSTPCFSSSSSTLFLICRSYLYCSSTSFIAYSSFWILSSVVSFSFLTYTFGTKKTFDINSNILFISGKVRQSISSINPFSF